MDKIEEKIIKIIDDNREKIVDFARDIYTHAELGYKEFKQKLNNGTLWLLGLRRRRDLR